MTDPSTISEVREWIEVGGKIVAWVIQTVGAFVDGNDHARRLVDVLPEEMQSDLKHLRERQELRKQLADKLGD